MYQFLQVTKVKVGDFIQHRTRDAKVVKVEQEDSHFVTITVENPWNDNQLVSYTYPASEKVSVKVYKIHK